MRTIPIKEKDGRITEYVLTELGVLKQLYPERYTYDKGYITRVYDSPEYMRKAKALQTLRWGFIQAVTTGEELTSLIDIGYGNGAFLSHVYASSDVSLYGFDITGIPFPMEITAGFDNEWYEHEYHAMTFWDVLEHFPDLSFLSYLRATYVIMSCPWCHFYEKLDQYGMDVAIQWFTDWHHRKPNEHLHHFDKKALIDTFNNHGYECISSSNIEDMIRKRGENNILTAAFKRI